MTRRRGTLFEDDFLVWPHHDFSHQIVDDLPDLLRQVVVLTYFQGMKYQDAADVLGVPLGTVKSRLHAALVKLTECWHKLVPGENADGTPKDEPSGVSHRVGVK